MKLIINEVLEDESQVFLVELELDEEVDEVVVARKSQEGAVLADNLDKDGVVVMWPEQTVPEQLDLEDGIRFFRGLQFQYGSNPKLRLIEVG